MSVFLRSRIASPVYYICVHMESIGQWLSRTGASMVFCCVACILALYLRAVIPAVSLFISFSRFFLFVYKDVALVPRNCGDHFRLSVEASTKWFNERKCRKVLFTGTTSSLVFSLTLSQSVSLSPALALGLSRLFHVDYGSVRKGPR